MQVFATYAAKMTERREQRIRAALKQCGACVIRGSTVGRFGDEEFRVYFTDISWTSNEDGTWTELRVDIGDDMERGARLAAELRACGMVASVQCDDEAAE
jgi:GGDEF domain-containing protein